MAVETSHERPMEQHAVEVMQEIEIPNVQVKLFDFCSSSN